LCLLLESSGSAVAVAASLGLLTSLAPLCVLIADGRCRLIGFLLLDPSRSRDADALATLAEGLGGAVLVDLDVLGRPVAWADLDGFACAAVGSSMTMPALDAWPAWEGIGAQDVVLEGSVEGY
jgi:hypothetical protein